MTRAPSETLITFVGVSSVSGSEHAFTRLLYEWISGRLAPEHLELQEVGSGRHNLIAWNGQPSVFLTSHTDTVPVKGTVHSDGARVFGPGACDAKGQIVAQLYALERAISHGLQDFGCFYVVGEEVDGAGAQAAMSHEAVRGPVVINGEPTNCRFVSSLRGVVDVRIETRGLERHSSVTPVESAIHSLLRGLTQLLETSSASIVNIGTIGGGVAPNVAAGRAEARVCIRSKDDGKSVIESVRQAFPHASIHVEDLIEPIELHVPQEHFPGISVDFCCDSHYYRNNFSQSLLFGPGDISVAHSPGEFLELADLDVAIDVLHSFLLRHLS